MFLPLYLATLGVLVTRLYRKFKETNLQFQVRILVEQGKKMFLLVHLLIVH